MKTININQLQARISRVMKDVERGETYEVMRYSRPIAIIRPKDFDENTGKFRCSECIEKIERVMSIVEDKKKS